MDVCVCLSGADGRVVEGRATDTLPTPPRGQQGSNPRPDGPPMDVVLSRKEKGEERVGVGGRGKYPGAPPHMRKKKRGKNKPTAKVPDRPNGERGKAITKKKNKKKVKKTLGLEIHLDKLKENVK
jgi:hypothetical protein